VDGSYEVEQLLKCCVGHIDDLTVVFYTGT